MDFFNGLLGRLFGRLQKLGLYDNTMIVYTCDHGDFLFDHGLLSKSQFLEGPSRIPLLIKPVESDECIRDMTCSALVELSDILPTFCESAGARIPDNVDGKSLIPLLGNPELTVRDFLHGNIDQEHMYRRGAYKYLYFAEDGRELVFNLDADPGEENDLSGDLSLLKELRAEFMSHLQQEGHEHVQDGHLRNLKADRNILEYGHARNVIGWQNASENYE